MVAARPEGSALGRVGGVVEAVAVGSRAPGRVLWSFAGRLSGALSAPGVVWSSVGPAGVRPGWGVL